VYGWDQPVGQEKVHEICTEKLVFRGLNWAKSRADSVDADPKSLLNQSIKNCRFWSESLLTNWSMVRIHHDPPFSLRLAAMQAFFYV